MERKTLEVYNEAVEYFAGDPELVGLLGELAEDESRHASLIDRSTKAIEAIGDMISPLTIDEETRARIEAPQRDCRRKLVEGTLTKEDILRAVAELEFSEWNDLFVYVMTTLAKSRGESTNVVAAIEHHRKKVRDFYRSKPETEELFEQVAAMPPLWEETILVVDDFEPLIELMKAILTDEGIVESAANGNEALGKIDKMYYAAIITDVEMPGIDGMELYRQASERFPAVKGRFLFFTGSDQSERLAFFKDNDIPYILKPASIAEIRKAVKALLVKNLEREAAGPGI